MADKTINDLTEATGLSDNDLFEIENTGNNSRKVKKSTAHKALTGFEKGPVGAVPTAASLTAANATGASIADGTDALIISGREDSTLASWYKTAPAAPFNVYCRIDQLSLSTSSNTTALQAIYGIVLRDGSDGEVVTCGLNVRRLATGGDGSFAMSIDRWTSAGAFSATGTIKYTNYPPKWLRVNVTSTTITFYVSWDGKNWHEVGTETISTFIDAVTQYGVGCYAIAANTEVILNVSYLSETAPA